MDEQTRKMARRVADFKVKVTSPAAKEMKRKAIDVINQNR